LRPSRTRSARLDGRSTIRARRGVSLVELLLSMIMLVVAVGGLVSTSASVTQQIGSGMAQTLAASIAQARLDSLSSLACQELAASAASGSVGHEGVQESWTVTDGRNIKTIAVNVTIAPRGPMHVVPLRYQTIVPCRD
jgi:Tfp pilus assembly protein PilV